MHESFNSLLKLALDAKMSDGKTKIAQKSIIILLVFCLPYPSYSLIVDGTLSTKEVSFKAQIDGMKYLRMAFVLRPISLPF